MAEEARLDDSHYTLVETRRSDDEGMLSRAVRGACRFLGMDVAYLSEFQGDDVVYREVESLSGWPRLERGLRLPADQTYCRNILEGRLPRVINDTSQMPVARALPVTRRARIGAHVGVPIRLKRNRTFGMLGCFRHTPDERLNEHTADTLLALAEVIGMEMARDRKRERQVEQLHNRIRRIVEEGGVRAVGQPIYDLVSGEPFAVECLARFPRHRDRTPTQWFNAANQHGIGVELELAAIDSALEIFDYVPDGLPLSINAQPETLLDPRFAQRFAHVPKDRVIVEITEHLAVADYAALQNRLHGLRSEGVRIAVDDAGAGYSSLNHVLALRPDMVKLDIGLTRDIHEDQPKQALARSLADFAAATGITLVAEGIEKDAERTTLTQLGIQHGQGFYLSHALPRHRLRKTLLENLAAPSTVL